MNTARFLSLLIVALALFSEARAQTNTNTVPLDDHRFLLTFNGASVSNTPAGTFGANRVNNRTLLLPYAQAGTAPLTNLALVYHLNSDPRGDSIEVYNTQTGQVVDTPYLLYFADDQGLGRAGLTNSVATQVRKIHYVYTSQNSHSMGACLLSEHLYKNSDGTLNNAIIMGDIYWVLLPQGDQPMQVFNGAIFSGKMIK